MLKNKEKFALVSVYGAGHRLRKPSYQIAPNLTLLTKQFVEIDSLWKNWMGEIQSERLKLSNLNIIIQKEVKDPNVIDSDNEDLSNLAHLCFNALLLVAGFNCDYPPFIISGAMIDGNLKVQTVSSLQKPGINHVTPEFLIEESNISELRDIFATLKNFLATKSHSRIQRGIRSFINGINTFFAEDRIHNYVRSLESFIVPTKGETGRQFKSKTELFIGTEYHTLINDIYSIRSNVEHMHDSLKGLSHLSGRDVEKLCVIVEGIARYCIKTILLDQTKLIEFSDNNIENFWKDDNKILRENLFREKFDLRDFTAKMNEAAEYLA
ncbi:hypothetical protein [Leptospira saintgironsiae]|uniref:Apea-like HEPN domain-containing protein n=1 Tax=Leptospira saintgironsiae TaxID=2023183 RepID=A0A2M9Y7V8_9LEPT|nr:hypothetical protein [Leptospira saintgironsiae]PJZ47533.1 hypothetical protein CH362_18740 [Leptospira saintgironsiae]